MSTPRRHLDAQVAVVGTGASAVQFVPSIAPEVGHMSVFQRSGNWFLPRRNRRYPAAARAAIRWVPGLQRWRRLFLKGYLETLTVFIRHPRTVGRLGALYSRLFMRTQLTDPEVRRKAWPDYTFGCKRILFSSHYLPALCRDNVELVTEAITEVTPDGVRTGDGRDLPQRLRGEIERELQATTASGQPIDPETRRDALERAVRRGGDGWARWSTGSGAQDAAAWLDDLAGDAGCAP